MKKYTPHIIAFLVASVYTFSTKNTYDMYTIADIIGVLIVPAILSLLVMIFVKDKTLFPKLFMWTTIVLCSIVLLGKLTNS